MSPHCGVRPPIEREAAGSGGERYEWMLLNRLPDFGVRLSLGIPYSRRLSAETVAPGWDVTLLPPGLRWPVAPAAFVPYVLARLRRGQVNLLRGHSVLYTGPALFAARALARARIPIVLHHHHTEGRWTRLEAELLRRADAVITDSDFSLGQLRAAGVAAERIRLVRPGVEPPPEVEPWDGSWPAPGLKLLYLSPLLERKRPDLALWTLAEIARNGVQASLVVAGDGPLRRGIADLARELGLETLVRSTGFVTEREKWQLLAAADAMLFPSMLEGFGIAVAEAQVAGLPVVAVAATAASEIVDDGLTGFVVDPRPEAFAAAVLRLADADVRHAMGARARKRAARFDWAETARAVSKVYASVAAAGGRAAS